MKRIVASVFIGLVAVGSWAAGQGTEGAGDSTTGSGVEPAADPAIGGYDPVAYFTQGEARSGSPNIPHEHQGVVWYFVSSEHRSLFIAEPTKYMPWFGQFCANGLSDRHVVDANPVHWMVDDGRLFLFYSARGRRTWVNGDLGSEFRQAQDYYREALGSDAIPGDPTGYR